MELVFFGGGSHRCPSIARPGPVAPGLITDGELTGVFQHTGSKFAA